MPMIEAGRDMPTYRESLLDGAKLDSDDRLERESMGTYSFLSKVNGILPGYGGFRPGNRRLSFKTGFGGVPKPAGTTRFKPDGTDLGPGGWVRAPRPQFGGQGQHPPPRTMANDQYYIGKPPDELSPNAVYLRDSGGVKVGYAGFIPHSKKTIGASTRGGVDGTRPDLKKQIENAQGADTIPEGQMEIGMIKTPGMVHAHIERCGPNIQAPPMSGAALGYCGYRPKNPTDAQLAVSPYRREHTEMTEKIGVGRNKPPQRATSADAYSRRPAWGPKPLQPHEAALGVNDWNVHQKEPPPPLPPKTNQYLCNVGGIKSGYAGFVPQGEKQIGEPAVGMHEWYADRSNRGGHSGFEQRGHRGKANGAVLRVKPDRDGMSKLAGGAVVGYRGHCPGHMHSFGCNPWSADKPVSPNEWHVTDIAYAPELSA